MSTGRPSIVPIPRDEPIGLQPDVLERFKHMLRLSHHMDPNYLGELEKLENESPELYHRYVYSGRRIPELKAYIMELEKLPPRMKPNSFIIRVLTEGTDCYSIRVIPGGNGARSDEGDGTLNSEEKVGGESVLRPGTDCRFHLEHWHPVQGWTSTEPTFNSYSIVPSFNLRLVETKTGKVIYTMITQFSIGDAIRANAGDFVTEVTE